jgi:hypothetical protein
MSEMTSPGDERVRLDGAEGDFVERLAAAYAPPPMTAGERAAFDEGVRSRLERPRLRRPLIPAIAAAAAATLLWFAISDSIGPRGVPGEEEVEAVVASSWEDELFLSSDLDASEDRDESEALPGDYLAIAGAFLDG